MHDSSITLTHNEKQMRRVSLLCSTCSHLHALTELHNTQGSQEKCYQAPDVPGPTQTALQRRGPQFSSGADCYLMYENTNRKYLGTLFIVVNWIERSPLVGLHTYCIVLRTPNANDTDLVRLTFKLSNPLGCCEGLLEIDGRASTAEWCCSLLSERLLTCQLKVCCFNLHLLSDLTFSFLASLHRIAFSLDPLFNNFQNLPLSSSDEGMLRRANIYSLVLKKS